MDCGHTVDLVCRKYVLCQSSMAMPCYLDICNALLPASIGIDPRGHSVDALLCCILLTAGRPSPSTGRVGGAAQAGCHLLHHTPGHTRSGACAQPGEGRPLPEHVFALFELSN